MGPDELTIHPNQVMTKAITPPKGWLYASVSNQLICKASTVMIYAPLKDNTDVAKVYANNTEAGKSCHKGSSLVRRIHRSLLSCGVIQLHFWVGLRQTPVGLLSGI